MELFCGLGAKGRNWAESVQVAQCRPFCVEEGRWACCHWGQCGGPHLNFSEHKQVRRQRRVEESSSSAFFFSTRQNGAEFPTLMTLCALPPSRTTFPLSHSLPFHSAVSTLTRRRCSVSRHSSAVSQWTVCLGSWNMALSLHTDDGVAEELTSSAVSLPGACWVCHIMKV